MEVGRFPTLILWILGSSGPACWQHGVSVPILATVLVVANRDRDGALLVMWRLAGDGQSDMSLVMAVSTSHSADVWKEWLGPSTHHPRQPVPRYGTVSSPIYLM